MENGIETGTVVVGGGSCGSVVAARLVEAGEHVVLLEAGPDYGSRESGLWPATLLDPALMPFDSHSWGYLSEAVNGRPAMELQRARVIGGCSAHNGCAVVSGNRADYDDWESLGNPGWNAERLLPLLETATEKLEVLTPAAAELTPFHQTVLEAAPAAGLPFIDDLLSLDASFGIGIGPVNIHDGVRWNASFAYLDEVRRRPEFRLVANAMADRMLFERDGFSHACVFSPDGDIEVHAERIVLAGGTYGTPLLLQRSGIGSTDDLEEASIEPLVDLPGVGHGLMDHPAVQLTYTGSEKLTHMLDQFVAEGGMPREEGTIALTQSSRCEGPFDLHIYPIAHRNGVGDWDISISAAVMASRSTGFVRSNSPDASEQPLIDHGYLTDAGDYDRDALVDAVNQIRSLARCEPLAGLLGEETTPGRDVTSQEDLQAFVLRDAVHDYHPTSSCRMGPEGDQMACVDHSGQLRGVSGVTVADASIMPRVPVANTNLPALAVAEKVTASIVEELNSQA